MRTRGTVRCSGCNDHDRNEGTDQEESKQPRHPSPSHHRRPPLSKHATVAITPAALRQLRDRDSSSLRPWLTVRHGLDEAVEHVPSGPVSRWIGI
jgi:hypothetical protein